MKESNFIGRIIPIGYRKFLIIDLILYLPMTICYLYVFRCCIAYYFYRILTKCYQDERKCCTKVTAFLFTRNHHSHTIVYSYRSALDTPVSHSCCHPRARAQNDMQSFIQLAIVSTSVWSTFSSLSISFILQPVSKALRIFQSTKCPLDSKGMLCRSKHIFRMTQVLSTIFDPESLRYSIWWFERT